MKFKVDENLPDEVEELLKKAGYDAETVYREDLGGADDTLILSRSISENRVIITLDKRFSDVIRYPPEEYPGFIVLRLQKQSKVVVVNVMQRVISQLTEKNVKNKLWIVNETSIRIRPTEERE